MRFGTYYRTALMQRLGLAHVRGRVLDVGGFDGFWLSHLEADNLVTIDMEAIRSFSGITYLRGNGEQLPFRDDTFDVVFAFEVLEHVDREEPFIAELMRVLRPGGSLFLSTPHQDIRIFPGVVTRWAHRRWQHYRTTGYTPGELQRLFAACDPSKLHIRQLRTSWLRTLYLPIRLIWRLGRWPGESIARWLARKDSEQQEGAGGYLLAEIVK